MKHLIKPLEWTINSKGEPIAMCPSHYYTIIKDGEKYTVKRVRYQDGHKDDCTGFASVTDAVNFSQDDYVAKMTKWLNNDPLTDTLNWFKEAKPEPTIKDIATQIGCHFEEVEEMCDAVECHTDVHDMAEAFKSATLDDADLYVCDINDAELLDSLADQIVTAVGVAYMMGFDIVGALKEVNASNWSKFVDGKAVTDENGKIIKGESYFKPELGKFVGGNYE